MDELLQFIGGLSPEMATNILIGVGVVAVALIVLRFAKQIAIFLGIAGALVLGIALLSAMSSQAKATQRAAEAATAASVGQTANSVGVTILSILLVLVILAGGGAVLYFYVRMRRAESQTGDKGWVAGPNALWGRKGQPTLPATGSPDPMAMLYQMQMLMMQQMMNMIGRMGWGYLPPPPAPPQYPQDPRLPGGGWWPDEFEE
jgi:hypothetical protein